MNKIGIYVHVPFCATKCPYCDFYTGPYNKDKAAAYTVAVIRNIENYSGKYEADTLFFGGGTPSLLGENISRITNAAKSAFSLSGAEITIEANPKTVNKKLMDSWLSSGVNRISFGVQSLDNEELSLLGRRHTASDALTEIEAAKACGFNNISADLMLGIPHQTKESVKKSISGLANAGVTHISAYILQIEQGTEFFKQGIESQCPSEEETAEIYLFAVSELEKLGFLQYEISNFAKTGFRSKHNLKYWHCEEYLGFGASAHSFIGKNRFAVTENLSEYISLPFGKTYITDDNAGTAEEYEMLALRLCEGIKRSDLSERFGEDEFNRIKNNAENKIGAEFINISKDSVSLTPKGFLVSNDLIASIIF